MQSYHVDCGLLQSYLSVVCGLRLLQISLSHQNVSTSQTLMLHVLDRSWSHIILVYALLGPWQDAIMSRVQTLARVTSHNVNSTGLLRSASVMNRHGSALRGGLVRISEAPDHR